MTLPADPYIITINEPTAPEVLEVAGDATVLEIIEATNATDYIVEVVEGASQGLPGPPGPGNLVVGPTPPTGNVTDQTVWVDTSGI